MKIFSRIFLVSFVSANNPNVKHLCGLMCLINMKTTFIIIFLILAIMIITQGFVSKSTKQTEQLSYQVVKVFGVTPDFWG